MDIQDCAKCAKSKGYCREHAEYIRQNTTLLAHSPTSWRELWPVLAVMVVAGLVAAAIGLKWKPACEQHPGFYLKRTALECPKPAAE